MMNSSHIRISLCIFCILAAATVTALPHPTGGEDREFNGGSYLTVIRDQAGYFASRSVITLHADRTMSVTDSGQAGPTSFFSSQQGGWKPKGSRRIVARTIDFNFTPGVPGIARTDYTIRIAGGQRLVSGTITVMTFPLESGDALDGEGTLLGTFAFVGELIEP